MHKFLINVHPNAFIGMLRDMWEGLPINPLTNDIDADYGSDAYIAKQRDEWESLFPDRPFTGWEPFVMPRLNSTAWPKKIDQITSICLDNCLNGVKVEITPAGEQTVVRVTPPPKRDLYNRHQVNYLLRWLTEMSEAQEAATADDQAHPDSGHFKYGPDDRRDIAVEYRRDRAAGKALYMTSWVGQYGISSRTLRRYLEEFPVDT